MGLVLYPADGDDDSPDISWSYTGFGNFRAWLAELEGFTLHEMSGFGGERPWSAVSTPLLPLLDHSDCDGPDLAPEQCAALLPRLGAIAATGHGAPEDPVLQRRMRDVRQLVDVLRVCVEKDVALRFG